MKFALVAMGFLSISAVLNIVPSADTTASAQCVIADVSVQAAINGSQKPARQTNQVDMAADRSCVGNSSVSTSTQVQVGGTGEVVQQRRSRHRLSGGSNPYGASVNGPTVAVPVQVQVNVDNPADRLRY